MQLSNSEDCRLVFLSQHDVRHEKQKRQRGSSDSFNLGVIATNRLLDTVSDATYGLCVPPGQH